MAGYKNQQGRKPKASTIVERQRQPSAGGAEQQRRLPAAPRHLTDVAKTEWRRMGRLLLDAGLLTTLDTTALAAYCMAYARHLEAEWMLQGPPGFCRNCDPRNEDEPEDCCRPPFHLLTEFGMVIKGRLGKAGPSPYSAMAKDAMAQVLRFLGEFGMTPASRSRIPREKDPEKRQRQPAGTGQKEEEPIDPRDVLQMAVQAAKN